MRLVENAPEDWPSVQDLPIGGYEAIFDSGTAQRIRNAKRSVLETGNPVRLEIARRRNGEKTRWYDMHIEADQASAAPGAESLEGRMIRGLFVSLNDITELKEREETLRTLLYEVSHRSRNLLAILQSVLGHTARSADNIAVFERKFRGRIAALAHSQDLITRSNWEGVRFHRLVMNQLSEYLRHGIRPPALLGPDLLIGPNSTLHLGLALHELAANSSIFGVLSHGDGEITIESSQNGENFSVMWSEILNVEVETTRRSGFGRAILSQIVPKAVNGQFDLDITPYGVRYQINWSEPGL